MGRKKKANSKTSHRKETVKVPLVAHRESTEEYYDPSRLADDRAWQLLMEPELCKDPDTAKSLARVLLMLKEAIESGPEGVKRASYTLSDGITLAYQYTETNQLAFKLFILQLEGSLRVEDDPVRVLKAAISHADP
jgi:hypothetical protein